MSDLVEFGNELVIVPRLCELCWQHTAVLFWLGSWPYFYACRACWEAWSPIGEVQPWVRPIGWRGDGQQCCGVVTKAATTRQVKVQS